MEQIFPHLQKTERISFTIESPSLHIPCRNHKIKLTAYTTIPYCLENNSAMATTKCAQGKDNKFRVYQPMRPEFYLRVGVNIKLSGEGEIGVLDVPY